MHTMIFLAFVLGVMLSPDTLILLGNTLGHEAARRSAVCSLLAASTC